MIVSPEMRTIIEDAYRVFKRYPAVPPLVVCNCGYCLSQDDEAALVAAPVRELSVGLLHEYIWAMSAFQDPFSVQYRHFLPRFMELYAEGRERDLDVGFGLWLGLKGLGPLRWRPDWPPEQVDVLDRYFIEFFRARLAVAPTTTEPPYYPRLSDGLRDTLVFIIQSGGDIAPALAEWNETNTTDATLHLAATRSDVRYDEQLRPYLQDAFLGQHEEKARLVGAFLARPEVEQRIEQLFFSLDDGRLQMALSNTISEWEQVRPT